MKHFLKKVLHIAVRESSHTARCIILSSYFTHFVSKCCKIFWKSSVLAQKALYGLGWPLSASLSPASSWANHPIRSDPSYVAFSEVPKPSVLRTRHALAPPLTAEGHWVTTPPPWGVPTKRWVPVFHSSCHMLQLSKHFWDYLNTITFSHSMQLSKSKEPSQVLEAPSCSRVPGTT